MTIWDVTKIQTRLLRGLGSNIIRDFLRFQYYVDIPWPLDNPLTYRSANNYPNKESYRQAKGFSITNCDNQGCISIHPVDNIEQSIFVSLFDFQGRKLSVKQTKTDEEFCYRELQSGIYIITIFEPNSRIYESHKIAKF